MRPAQGDGFRVTPKKGRAALFYRQAAARLAAGGCRSVVTGARRSMMPDGNLDVDAIHGACPVRKGTKWGANWWYAARPAHRAPLCSLARQRRAARQVLGPGALPVIALCLPHRCAPLRAH
jgi:hypothetical protein